MSSDYSKILWQAYEQFMLPLGGKKVPTPYRKNELGSLQKVGPEFQGKSSPEVLTKTTKKLAREQSFNLEAATVEQIRDFMRKNQLGIDCSGFTYRLLNYLVRKVSGQTLEAAGFPHVGRTNVAKLTADEYTIEVDQVNDIKPGDLIKLMNNQATWHCLVVLEKNDRQIIYAHSSSEPAPGGVSQNFIEIIDRTKPLRDQKWLEKFQAIGFESANGDGVRRLKILS